MSLIAKKWLTTVVVRTIHLRKNIWEYGRDMRGLNEGSTIYTFLNKKRSITLTLSH